MKTYSAVGFRRKGAGSKASEMPSVLWELWELLGLVDHAEIGSLKRGREDFKMVRNELDDLLMEATRKPSGIWNMFGGK